jgi:hypothetical protein
MKGTTMPNLQRVVRSLVALDWPIVDWYGSRREVLNSVGANCRQLVYPKQLRRDFVVLVNPEGDLPYNRWGLYGDFAVVGRRRWWGFAPLSENECQRICDELRVSPGYLDCQTSTIDVASGAQS